MLDAIRETIAPRQHTCGAAPPTLDADADSIGRIISNSRRRHTIQFVAQEGATTLSDLATYVARQENEPPLGGQDRKRAYVSLYQNHVDILDDADVVQYDSDRKTIQPARNLEGFSALVDIIEATGGDDDE